MVKRINQIQNLPAHPNKEWLFKGWSWQISRCEHQWAELLITLIYFLKIVSKTFGRKYTCMCTFIFYIILYTFTNDIFFGDWGSCAYLISDRWLHLFYGFKKKNSIQYWFWRQPVLDLTFSQKVKFRIHTHKEDATQNLGIFCHKKYLD